jgi:hypothetical protein
MSVLLKQRVKGRVKFLFYTQGELWYRVVEDGFDFPVPVSDTGNGTFKDEDKGIYFMRYIRRHMEMLKQARTEADGQ